jgi:hypothetical protein
MPATALVLYIIATRLQTCPNLRNGQWCRHAHARRAGRWCWVWCKGARYKPGRRRHTKVGRSTRPSRGRTGFTPVRPKRLWSYSYAELPDNSPVSPLDVSVWGPIFCETTGIKTTITTRYRESPRNFSIPFISTDLCVFGRIRTQNCQITAPLVR